MPTTVHTSGSWYRQGKQQDTMRWLRDSGFEVLCDWTSAEHQKKDKWSQYKTIVDAISRADVLFFSFEGMEDRTSSATFTQFDIAASQQRAPIVVYDPAKATRAHRNRAGHPVHPSFSHLMGHALTDSDKVHWTDDLADAHTELKKHLQA